MANSDKRETPSLNRTKPAEKAEEVVKPVLVDERNSPFSDEALQENWKAFGAERIQNGTSDTERIILDRALKKTGDDEITIYLESRLEISILEKCEQELLQFLKVKLDNTSIYIEKEVTEIKSTKSLYTARDKFEFMAKQNPNLQDLKDKLGLDYDY